jgi:hypothetical protein
MARMVLKCAFNMWNGACMDRIDLVQNRDRWQALVNVVMNHQVL